MKNLLNLLLIALLAFTVGCKKEDDDNNNDSKFIELRGDLPSQTLTANNKYLIVGQVFVRNNQTLTIEPGTIIFGDKRTKGTLIIDKGGKIIANGTADKPIVFTSALDAGIRDRGDWGGLVILGNANCNQNQPAIEGISPAVNFGTFQSAANDDESSGSLRYVRVEFGGIELTPNNETNSITMGGVGRGTIMENVMVSFGGDDGFEWFGGTVNGKNLISHAMWDDDFDVDFGYSGNVQFAIAIRYPGFADQSQSNGFECDNGPNDNDVEPYTTGTFSNVTVIGPIKTGTSTSNANYAHAIDLRRRTAVSIANSVFVGFPRGVRMNQPSVVDQYTAGRGVLVNNIMVGTAANAEYQAGSGVTTDAVKALWEANNVTIAGPASDEKHSALGLNIDLFFGSRQTSDYNSSPDFRVTTGTAASGASFSNPKFSEANRTNFFDKTVTFRGAFGATNWAAGWAEFDPIDKAY